MSIFININLNAVIRLFFMPGFIILMLLPSIDIQGQDFNLEDQLILWLPIDGNAIDQSGNNVHTEVNGPLLTADRFGNPNSAYAFDGYNDYIKLNNDLPLITAKTFTILIWARITGTSNTYSAYHTLFQQRDDDSFSTAKSTIHYNITPALRLRIALRTSTTPDALVNGHEADIPDASAWHHYVARLDENRNIDLFIDGKKVYSGILDETGDFVTSVDHVDLGVHTYSNAVKGALNGILDDVYIYNRALDDCEIQYIYAGSLPEER